MKLFERIKVARDILLNRYEGAQPSSPKRSYIPSFNRDARHDANSWSRWEMTRKIRYFEQNVWLCQANGDTHVKYTVGANGLTITPASSDTEWNKRMTESYMEFCEAPVLDSTIDMPQFHKQIARAAHFENDCFIHKTRSKLEGKQAKPKVQLIESHRCSAPGTQYSVKDNIQDCVDGVQLFTEPDGQVTAPVGYWFIDDALMSQWAFRPAKDIHHVFDPERAGMYRGITPYHSVINTLHDLDDLEILSMDKAKGLAEITNIITSPSGELNRDGLMNRKFGGMGAAVVNNNSAKEDDLDRRIQLYRKIVGARTIALKTGETMERFTSDQPSVAEQWFWVYKIGQICRVAGVPLILLFPEIIKGLQGTLVRSILDDAHETFKEKFFLYARAAVNIYRYYAGWAIYNDPRVIDAPADWKKCHVTPPRAVNVDVGYTSAATLAELEAGIQNWDDIAARNSTTAENLIRKKVRNVIMIKQICEEESAESGFEVEPAEVSAPIADVLQKLASAEASEAAADAANNPEPEEGGQEKKPAAAGSKKRRAKANA
jgi:capsid protein